MYSRMDLGPRVQLEFEEGSSRTKQSQTDECDINKIMAKYLRTGAIAHGNKFAGDYGYASSVSFHEAMNCISKGESMFSELPSDLRTRFSNDVGEFLDFVQNPENSKEMISLGLTKTGEQDSASGDSANQVEVVSPPEEAAEQPSTDST